MNPPPGAMIWNWFCLAMLGGIGWLWLERRYSSARTIDQVGESVSRMMAALAPERDPRAELLDQLPEHDRVWFGASWDLTTERAL